MRIESRTPPEIPAGFSTRTSSQPWNSRAARVSQDEDDERSEQDGERYLGVSDPEAEEQLPVPIVDVGPRVTPLQQDEGHRKHQHRELEEQADRQHELLAPPLLQADPFLEPAAVGSVVVAQALREAIHPQQQQIDKRQDGAGDDQLLRQEAGERQIARQARTRRSRRP